METTINASDFKLADYYFGKKYDRRIQKLFKSLNIITLEDLSRVPESMIKEHRNIGDGCMNRIYSLLRDHGLSFMPEGQFINDFKEGYMSYGLYPTDDEYDFSGVDWEHRRYELAKELFLRHNADDRDIADLLVMQADMLIRSLRGIPEPIKQHV